MMAALSRIMDIERISHNTVVTALCCDGYRAAARAIEVATADIAGRLETIRNGLDLLDRISRLPEEGVTISLGDRDVWVCGENAILDGDPNQSLSLLDQATKEMARLFESLVHDDSIRLQSSLNEALERLGLGYMIWQVGEESCPWPIEVVECLGHQQLGAIARATGWYHGNWDDAREDTFEPVGDVVIVHICNDSNTQWAHADAHKTAWRAAQAAYLLDMLSGSRRLRAVSAARDVYRDTLMPGGPGYDTSRKTTLAALLAYSESERPPIAIIDALEATEHRTDPEIRKAAQKTIHLAIVEGHLDEGEAQEFTSLWNIQIGETG